VGNAVEVREWHRAFTREFAEGARPVLDLSIELAARMVVLSHLESSVEKAAGSNSAGAHVRRSAGMFSKERRSAGGDPRVCDDPAGILPLTDKVFKVESARSGFVRRIDTEEVGHAIARSPVGGRVRMEDQSTRRSDS